MSHLAQRATAVPLEPGDPVEPAWSGERHGPVAEMHRTIEAAWRLDRAAAALPHPPIEVALRRVSQGAGWMALAAAFAIVGSLLL